MKTVIKSIVLGAVVLTGGALIMFALFMKRDAPAAVELPEAMIRVTATAMQPETVEVSISGLGLAQALDEVAIAPEVSGTVVEVHPNLDVGGIIPKGETIFEIDPSSYIARRDEAVAQVDQLENQLEELKIQFEIDTKRLETAERSRALAEKEFKRRQALLEKDEVGSQSDVDAQERAFNATVDAADQLGQAVKIYPMRIAQTEAMLASARARLDLAKIDLVRTKLLAPFDARVTQNSVEVGLYIAPGRELVMLANDTVVEISVPVSAINARDWIEYTGEPLQPGVAWFSELKPVDCEVRWTEAADDEHCWTGTLHRVGEYDDSNRQVYLVVRVNGEEAAQRGTGGLPLVSGMFCSVKIPGRTVEDVYRVPDAFVSYEDTVYMAVDGRLKTVPVERVLRQGDEVLVRGDLPEGALLITTRLTNPLENILLEIDGEDKGRTE